MDIKYGLALSGGGAKGAAHIGVLKALQEHNIKPQIVTGTSAGAIIAALYAIDLDVDQMMELMSSINILMFDFDGLGILKSVFTLNLPTGFVKGNNMLKKLSKITNDINIKDIQDKTIGIVATNVSGGENVIFTNGIINCPNNICINDVKLSLAIRASIGMPIIFSPVQLDNMLLIDGGVVNNCPADLAQHLGANFVIISDIDYNGRKVSNPNSGTEILSNIMGILLKEVSEDDMNELNVPKIVITLDELREIKALDFSKKSLNKAYKIGYEKASQVLESSVIKF